MDTLPEALPSSGDISQCEIVSCAEVALELVPMSPERKFFTGRSSSISLGDNTRERFRVSLSAVEPLTRETFLSLYRAYREEGQSLIIAVVLERDVDDPSLQRAFFFAAGMLNKLVIKKHGEEFTGRYSPATQVAANNPLTNLPIVGEIEYYLCESEERARFIGTDYTLWKRPSLRELFSSNGQLDLDNYESSRDSMRLNDLDANSLEALSRLIDLHRANVLSIIRVPFCKATTYGVLATIMLVLYAAGFAFSLSDVCLTQYIQVKMEWKDEISPQVIAVLPAVAVASSTFDWWTCRIFTQKESESFFRGKVITWLLLVLVMPIIYTVCELRQFKLMFLSAMMGYCAYHFLYSVCLFLANFKYQRPE